MIDCVTSQFYVNTRRSPNVGLLLGRRRRRRPSIKPTLGGRLVFAVYGSVGLNYRVFPVSSRLLSPWRATSSLCLAAGYLDWVGLVYTQPAS